MHPLGTGDDNNNQGNFPARLRAAEERIASHPACRALGMCDELQRSIEWVFLPNLVELLGLLERAANDEDLAIELMQNMYEPVIRERFQAAVTRGLHNYLASAMSLVDHVRAVMRGRTGTLTDEFVSRRSRLLTNPEVPFVQDLRNFTLHLALPFVGHTVTLPGADDPGGSAAGEVEVGVAQLLSWDGWSAASTSYLEQQGEAIALRHVIRKHGDLFLGLNTWLHTELSRENEPGLAELNLLIVERNAILYGVDFERAEELTRQDTLRRSQPRPPKRDEVLK
jgi:hypothetical protein